MAATTSVPISVPQIKNVQFLQIMRVVWWAVAGLGLLLFMMLIPFNWQSFQEAPSSMNISSDEYAIYAPPLFEGLTQLNIPTYLYASFKLLLSAFVLFVFYGMGFLIFRTRFHERIGMQAAFCFVALGAFLSVITGAETFYGIDWLDGLIGISGWILAIFGWGTLYMFLPLYPDGRFVPRWSVIAPLTWLGTIIMTVISPTSDWAGDGDSPIVNLILFLGVFGVPVAAQLYRYFKVSTPLQRQQTKWFIFALALLLTLIISFELITLNRLDPMQAVLADLADALSSLLFVLIPLSVGLAILRYRLWDIDLVINKSLVYGIVLALAIALFVLIFTALQINIGQSQPVFALIIAGLFSVILFKPTEKRIQNFVDRRIYRLNFDMNELIASQKDREITKPGALTGKKVEGYELGNVIGKGGMGEIYRGIGADKTVAVKILLPEFAQDKELLIRFQREYEAGKQLEHRHITKFYTIGAIEGSPYIIMEYIDGRDLRSTLAEDGLFDEETTRQIIHDICSALDVAHAVGYVHRDIKPANIMLRENGEAVLMDFGISKAASAHTITGTGAIGTIDYMAPEQIMSAKEVDHRADIYALGIVTYELLTGEKPFKGSPAQVMFAHIQQPAPSAHDINESIPVQISEAIERAMKKDVDSRFASAGAFAEALVI